MARRTTSRLPTFGATRLRGFIAVMLFLATGVLPAAAATAPGSAPSARSPSPPASQASSSPKGSSSATDSSSAIVRIVDFIAHPILQVTVWPVEHILAPGVEVLTYPTQPPIRYFLEENVIDRATGLFQFGPQKDFSVYPTLSLAAGTSSRTGLTLRDGSPFGRDQEKLNAYFSYFVNGDYRVRAFLRSRGLGGTPFDGKIAFALTRQESAIFYQPDVNTPYVHGLHSESYEGEIDYPLLWELRARVGFTLLNSRYSEAPPALANQAGNTLDPGFFGSDTGFDPTGAYRGLTQSFLDRIWRVGVAYDTRTNENIPLDGSRFDASWEYHDADLDHAFHQWRTRYTAYFKLGAERYELTAREEQQRGGLSVNRFLKELEYQRLRQSIFSRKVLVFQLYAGRSYEISGNSIPIYGLQSLGNGTPLRAYAGSRYRNYAMAAASTEYRFPMMRIMDGTIFNEYGVFGPSMADLDLRRNLRNSWGFGVRVRRPDMFLFRIEAAFNGLSGAVLNATADTPF